METSNTDRFLADNAQYANGERVHEPVFPGPQRIQPQRRVAVVACMDTRLDVENLLGLQTGDAHIIRNAGGVVTEDAIRVRGFICDVDTGRLEEVSYPGPMGSIG
jgi:carbonic anhydrase